MKNAEKYIRLYEEKADECFKKWGYYYPPKNWDEFLAWNDDTFQKYFKDGKHKDPVKKTKTYLDLLDTTNEFGFYIAFRDLNYETLNNVLYQTSRQELLRKAMTASGTDHCISLMPAASAFACNDFEIIDYFFPKELPHAKGTYYTEVAVNLLRVLYYKESDLQEEAIRKADKFLSTKITLWEKYAVTYFMSLVNGDAEQAGTCLQELCNAYQKIGSPKSDLSKCFASEIHGFYRFAKVIDEDFFNKIKRPKHACFFDGFEIWQKENDYPKGKLFYKYPMELDYMNKIFEAQLPVVALVEKDTPRSGTIYKNVEKFAADLTENVEKVM